jgi:transposase InsO family protein
MQLRLHANATTTPRTRAYIQASGAGVAALAGELGVSQTTIRRWKRRTGVADGSHVAKRLAISLTPLEERLVVALRTDLALPLDDIVEVMHRCRNPKLSRSAIHRCLRRNGLARRPKPARAKPGSFEPASVGFIHVDLKHLTRLNGRPSFVFVAIDRATRFVHIESIDRRDAATVAACLERFLAVFPHKVHTILTDNGSEFTDRFGAARWRRQRSATGRHRFDGICARHGIEHRLTRPFRPQTNGLVERFNRRLAEAIAAKAGVARNEGKNKFLTHAERAAFLERFVADYNRTRLKCLDYRAPFELLLNPPGPNTQAAIHASRRDHASRCPPIPSSQLHPSRWGRRSWVPTCVGMTLGGRAWNAHHVMAASWRSHAPHGQLAPTQVSAIATVRVRRGERSRRFPSAC